MRRSSVRKPSRVAFRFGMLAFAAILGAQSVWVLLAELSHPGVDRLPPEARAATAAAKLRSDANWAAYIGIVRGDLWAESAFTYADLLWVDAAPGSDRSAALQQARIRLDRAITDAPHQSGAWLLLGGLASRYSLPNVDAVEALKMSYYTDPSEPELAPLRLRVAAGLKGLSDIDLQQFVGRDLRLLFTRHQNSAVIEAHNAASPAGKRFIEETVKTIDPSAVGALDSQ
jgi:hypothetical protein